MNLKRLRGIATVALITIAAALFAGCSNSMAGSVDGGTGMAVLSLSATGIPNDYAEQFAKSYPTAATVASRSITPDTPYTPNSTGLTFYLTGTSETGKKLDGTEAIEVTLTETATGSGIYTMIDKATNQNVTLPSMSWNLVLTAYKDSAKAEPVLQGFCSVDLRNGSGTATFKLSPENLTTAGSVEITGKFPTHDNVATYTMGIYKKTSASESVDVASGTVTAGTATQSFTYNCTSIAPGSYLYKMIFKNNDGTITGSFIDTLVVDAGNALERDLGTIDVVNKKPGAPTSFTASLEKGSENADGTYRVKLSWTSGGGETNFEVELTEFTDGGTTAATGYPKIYGMASMDKDSDGDPIDNVENFQGSDVWAGKGGAMTYGDTEAYFKLKLGVVYEVRIRARNYVGTSAATSADWTARTAGTDSTGFVAYGSEKINRMKIEYNLNGGTLTYYDIDAGSQVPKTVNFTEYKSWDGTNNTPLLVISTSGTTANLLTKSGSPFAKWVDSTGAEATGADYKNLSVTASFGSSVTASASVADKKTDVAIGDITVNYTSPTGSTPVSLSENGTYIIPKAYGSPSTATELSIQLDLSKGYTNVQFELSYNGTQTMLPYVQLTTNQCKLSLDDYVAGKIQVRVIADTANATGMSQTLTFDLQ